MNFGDNLVFLCVIFKLFFVMIGLLWVMIFLFWAKSLRDICPKKKNITQNNPISQKKFKYHTKKTKYHQNSRSPHFRKHEIMAYLSIIGIARKYLQFYTFRKGNNLSDNNQLTKTYFSQKYLNNVL